MQKYTKSQLIAHIRTLGHKVELPLIVGVRSLEDKPNEFDDMIYLLTVDGFFEFKGTTNPGTYWLLNFMNPKGTALLKPGQYKYRFGFHHGYEALVQAAPVTVYRDSDKDTRSEESAVTETGYFGINIHRAHQSLLVKTVSKFSAGCSVIHNPKDFELFLSELKKSNKKEFLYSLIKEY